MACLKYNSSIGDQVFTNTDHVACVCMGGSYRCIVPYTHLGNGTGRLTVTLVAPLLFTGDPMRYEAVLHSCRTSPMGGGTWYRLVTVHPHGNFIVLPHPISNATVGVGVG